MNSKLIHDIQQASRRTDAQNTAIIQVIEASGEGRGMWAYSDVPEEGGPVELICVVGKRKWIIEMDGTVIEQPPDWDERAS